MTSARSQRKQTSAKPALRTSSSIEKEIEKIQRQLEPLLVQQFIKKNDLSQQRATYDSWKSNRSFFYSTIVPLLLCAGGFVAFNMQQSFIMVVATTALGLAGRDYRNEFIKEAELTGMLIIEKESELGSLDSAVEKLKKECNSLQQELEKALLAEEAERQRHAFMPSTLYQGHREREKTDVPQIAPHIYEAKTALTIASLPVDIKEQINGALNHLMAARKIIQEGSKQKNLEPAQLRNAKSHVTQGLAALELAEKHMPAINQLGQFIRYQTRLKQLESGLATPQNFYKIQKKWQWLFSDSSADISASREFKKSPAPIPATETHSAVSRDSKASGRTRTENTTRQLSRPTASASSTQTPSAFFPVTRSAPTPQEEDGPVYSLKKIKKIEDRIQLSKAGIARYQRMLEEEGDFIDRDSIINQIQLFTSGLARWQEKLNKLQAQPALTHRAQV